jgi:beta-aspartyl-peptidase (threonine type)
MSELEKQSLLNHQTSRRHKYVLVIHGGAGTMSKEGSTLEQQARYKAALASALRAGYEVLKAGGEAIDAAVAAVTVLEDCPLFNAGKGAVFNVDGKNELETSIMLSKPPASHPSIPETRHGLGVSLITHTRNPSQLARALYLAPSLVRHAFISGATAEGLGKSLGVEQVDPSYFFTEHRWREHRTGLGLPWSPFPPGHPLPDPSEPNEPNLDQMPKGTVGAVALDSRGCIATVTSTGGLTNKLVGRIGDTPLMGAGYWAEEWTPQGWFRRALHKMIGHRKRAVGISGTGDGDFFIRQATASTIARRMKYHHESLSKATRHAVNDLRREGGLGGVIAIDQSGNVALPLNSPGMYRGVIREDGIPKTAIFAEDEIA